MYFHSESLGCIIVNLKQIKLKQPWKRQEGKSVLVIDGRKIDTAREWLAELMRDQVGHKRLVVPDNLEWVVQLLR